MRRFVRIGGGLALAILFAALLIRNVDLGQVVLAATRLSVYVLAASAALVIAGYAVPALDGSSSQRRWRERHLSPGCADLLRVVCTQQRLAAARRRPLSLRVDATAVCGHDGQIAGHAIDRTIARSRCSHSAVERPLTLSPTGKARTDLNSDCGAPDCSARPHRSIDHFSGGDVAVGGNRSSAALRPVSDCRERRNMDACLHGGCSRHAVRSSARLGRRPHVCRLVA